MPSQGVRGGRANSLDGRSDRHAQIVVDGSESEVERPVVRLAKRDCVACVVRGEHTDAPKASPPHSKLASNAHESGSGGTVTTGPISIALASKPRPIEIPSHVRAESCVPSRRMSDV
jgi:hypothetical protein